MSPDTPIESDPAATAQTAGRLLRAAREKQGLHIAALAASIKVNPRKLEALENDRYEELTDNTFTRALAQTMCRTLKTDPRPVLALLPPAGQAPLEQVAGSLNTPFRERPGRIDFSSSLLARPPLVWAAVALVLAAVLVAMLPSSWWERAKPAPVVLPETPVAAPFQMTPGEPAASAASAPVVETVHAAPLQETVVPAIAAGSGTLQLRSSAPSWVDVLDGRGRRLLSRTVQPGEVLALDGEPPFTLTIGNAAVTQVSLRGKPVDLAASTRDNVARLELP